MPPANIVQNLVDTKQNHQPNKRKFYICADGPHTHTQTTLSHPIFRHTIFHTPLCHTPSFTHNFVTRSLSHTTFTHTIFHTQLCHTHTPSFFVIHHLSHTTLSHTTLFYFWILHHLLCLSFFPRPCHNNIWCSLLEEVALWGYPVL